MKWDQAYVRRWARWLTKQG